MKALYTTLLLLAATFSLPAQNLQFTNGCTDIDLCLDSTNCTDLNLHFEALAMHSMACSVDISYSYILDVFEDGQLQTQAMGDTNVLDYVLPVGTHQLRFDALDFCTGDTASCSFSIHVKDCVAPTAYCLPGLSSIPMPIGQGQSIELWASDFDLDSDDNCTDKANLQFSFSDDINDRTRLKTCDDVTGVPDMDTIYIWDEAGNYSTCIVSFLLLDCGADPIIGDANLKLCYINVDGESINPTNISYTRC
ncbi:MAG: hypothetical protein AAFP19_17610 [Bacteroidota bacterium]